MKRVALVVLFAFSGCWNFTADQATCQASGDCLMATPPALLSSNPTHEATGVSTTTDVTLFFSKPMRTSTVVLTVSPAVAFKPGVFEEDGQSGVFEPLAPLSHSQLYTVSVSGKDIDGNDLSAASFSFTTQPAPDTTAPALQSTVPSNGLTNVATTAKLVLTFSEAMDPSSLTLTSSPEFDWGDAAWSTDSRTVTLTPPEPLQGETMYVVAIAARDVAQNTLVGTNSVAFTTAKAPDVVPPEVVATAPLAAATMVSPNVSPSVTFSEQMDPAIMASSYFTINPAVPCAFAWDPSTTTLTCNHPSQANLAANTLYTVTIGTGAKDKSGVALASAFSFTFTTGSMQDMTPPTVTFSNPDGGTNNVPVCGNISVTFSEPMDKNVTQQAFAISSPQGVTGTFSWASNGAPVMTFNPDTNFNPGTQVSWQIGSTAKDLANNAMTGTRAFTFTTARNAGPLTLYANAAHSGYVRKTNTGSLSAAPGGSLLYVGDWPVGTTTHMYRSFLEFDLSSIPATASITNAVLYAYQSNVQGSPYSSLGSLAYDSLNYGAALTSAAYSQKELDIPSYCPPCAAFICKFVIGGGKPLLSSSSTLGWKATNISSALQGALAARKLQLRFQFSTKDTDNDAAQDWVTFYSPSTAATGCTGEPAENPSNQCKPFMRVTYTYP